MMGVNPPVLSDDAAAELLGVTVRQFRRWVRAGELPGRTLPDGSIVVSADELRRWAEAGDDKPEGEHE